MLAKRDMDVNGVGYGDGGRVFFHDYLYFLLACLIAVSRQFTYNESIIMTQLI